MVFLITYQCKKCHTTVLLDTKKSIENNPHKKGLCFNCDEADRDNSEK